eukprot:g1649.t1
MDQRHNGSTSASTEAARRAYLSSVFVRAGRAEFSIVKPETVNTNGTGSPLQRSRRNSKTGPTDAAMAAGIATMAPSVAVLSGLTFKGQFLRLVLWEAAGSSDNPGRQVSVTQIQVSGCLLSNEQPSRLPKNHRGAARGHQAFSGEDGDIDSELEEVLLDLGIQPLLAQGPSENKQARDRGGGGRRGVLRGSSRSVACVSALEGKGSEGGGRGVAGAEDSVAAEATNKVKQMLHVARTQERFHEAEMLCLQLDRVRSLASTLCSARRAQKRAARCENFDKAKRFRDDAREAEVWLLQAVRDASDILDAGGDGRPNQHQAKHPLVANTSPTAGTDVPSGAASPTSGIDVQEPAPSHDPGHDYSREKPPGGGSPNDLACTLVRRGSTSGDGGSEGVASNEERTPPWLTPSCPRSTEPWGALLKLPWPAGVQPDFRTVFSHKWATSTSVGGYRKQSVATGLGGDGGSYGGGSASRIPTQPSGLLRTIVRLVAASQDLRPPGPVPPDSAPFRQAGSADCRPALCTFFLPPAHLASGGDGDGDMAKVGESPVPVDQSNVAADNPVGKVGGKTWFKASGGKNEVAGGGGGSQPSTDVENDDAGGAVDHRAGGLGRAFGHPAADSSPAATHVVNFIEDNPDLAWSNSALRDPKQGGGVQHLGHVREDDHDSGQDEVTSTSKPEASRRSAKETQRRNPEDEGRDEGSAGFFSRMRSKRPGGGPTEEAVAAGTEVAARERLLEDATAPLKSGAAALPDIVGAGGFAEFIPLCDTVFGRVPMSAACSGFPARIRESSIRLCEAYLDLTADAAVEAYIAATTSCSESTVAPATTSIAAERTCSPSNLSPPASRTAPQRGLETGGKRGSRADLAGELEAEKTERPNPNDFSNSRDTEGSSGRARRSSSNRSSAIGAVVRAACLIAAQGLMDPNKDVWLAGADLARSALSLWSSVPAAVEEGDRDKEAANAVVAETALRRPNTATKKGSTSDHGHDIADDHHAKGTAAGRRGSVGSDDGGGSDTMSLSETSSESSEDTESPQRTSAQGVSTSIDSKRESKGSSPRSSEEGSISNTAAMPNVRAAVPLKDLRWGLELVLACVAPYLTNKAVASHEKGGDGVMRTTDGSAARPISNQKSARRSTSSFKDSRRKSVSSALDENSAGNAEDGAQLEGGEGSADGSEGREEELPPGDFSPGDPPLPEECESGEEGHGDAERSLLALRIVDFACRHPDIGPALVSSVLVGLIPCLVTWGRNTLPCASSLNQNRANAGREGMPRSPRCAAFTAGEAAASEALASGAIEMIAYMVDNFALLPLSDFSAEKLVAAAEGGMSFAGGTRSTSSGDGNGRRRNGVGERRRDGGPAGGWGARARGGERRGRARGSRRSLTSGQARKAGEALMLELFIRTSGSAHGGLGVGIDSCLESLLPVLNTARGINFLGRTAATVGVRASETRSEDKLSNGWRTEGRKEGGPRKDNLEAGGTSCVSTSEGRKSAETARESGKRALHWPNQRRPFVPKVEVRQRLVLPPTPPATGPTPDPTPSSRAVGNGRSVARGNGKHQSLTLDEDVVNADNIPRHDTNRGLYAHMSDSSSAERLSASTGKSAAASVVSEAGGGAPAANSGVHGDDGSSIISSSRFSNLSHGSLSSTSLEDMSEGEGGSSIDSTATDPKRGEVSAETKKRPVAAVKGSALDKDKSAKEDEAEKQTTAAESNRKSKKVFPILSFGGGNREDVAEPATGGVDDNTTSVESAKAATAQEKPAETPAGTAGGEANAKKGGGGLMSKLFGRGKK